MSSIPITLTGTVATEPHSKTLPSGRACASFRLAVNHWRLEKSTGEYVNDTTSWFGIDCYGPLASNCSMTLNPGMSVVIQGGLKIREWSTEERSGLAPTVIAEHIGPDLRYGTANYQKANQANKQPSAQPPNEAQNAPGWGGLPGQSSAEGLEAAQGAGGATFGARDGIAAGSGYDSEIGDTTEPGDEPGDTTDAEYVTGAEYSSATGDSTVDSGPDDDEGSFEARDEEGSEDEAIARDTAAVAAPF